METPNISAGKRDNKWLTLIAVAAIGFLAVMDMSITNISFPALTRALDTDTSTVLWVSAIYSLLSAGLTPVFGRIGDIFGRKRLFLIGIALFTVGLGLCAVSQSISQLIAARAIQGLGGAMIVALNMAIVTAVFPDNERGRALGILSACHLMGPLIGPTVGGLLLDAMGWRSIFYFRLPLCIIALILAWVLLSEQRRKDVSAGLDYLGAALLVSSISCLVLFFNVGGRLSFGEPAVLALLGGSAVLMFVFIINARKTAEPIVELSLFRNRFFTIGTLTTCIHNLTIAMRSLVMPFYLIDGRGFQTAEAGLLMSVGALCIIAISPVSGWLSDKVGSKVLCPVGMALTCVATYFISRLNADSTILQILLPQVLFGIGDAVFLSPNTSMVMGAAPRDKLGMASATLSTVRNVAMASGTVIAGAIYAVRQDFYAAEMAGAGLDEPVLTQLSLIGGFQDTLLVVAGILLIGVFVLVFGLWKQKSQQGLA